MKDIHERLLKHMKASQQRDKWALRAIKLLNDGKHKEGMKAAEKAEEWELKVKLLEGKL
jgi:hypothetical protein